MIHITINLGGVVMVEKYKVRYFDEKQGKEVSLEFVNVGNALGFFYSACKKGFDAELIDMSSFL